MNKLRLTPLLVLVLLLAMGIPAQPAYAMTRYIDTFDVDQNVQDSDGTPVCDTVDGASIWGGYRDVGVQRSSGSGTIMFEAAAGYGSHNDPVSGYGWSLLQWDGDDDSGTCPPPDPTTSIMDDDFTAGGATRFVIVIYDKDKGDATVRVRVYKYGGGSGDYAQYTWTVPNADGDYFLTADFTAFTANGTWDNSTDWQHVAAVTMLVDATSNAMDISFDFLGTDTPTAVTLAGLGATADAALFRWQLAGFLLPVAAVLSLAGVGVWVRLRKQDNE